MLVHVSWWDLWIYLHTYDLLILIGHPFKMFHIQQLNQPIILENKEKNSRYTVFQTNFKLMNTFTFCIL